MHNKRSLLSSHYLGHNSCQADYEKLKITSKQKAISQLACSWDNVLWNLTLDCGLSSFYSSIASFLPVTSQESVKFFVSTEPEFPNVYRRLLKIAEVFERLPKIAEDFQQLLKIVEDFPTTSKDNQRCRKIFDDFKTECTNDFQRISNQSRALLKSPEDVLMAWEIGLNAWDHNILDLQAWDSCITCESW